MDTRLSMTCAMCKNDSPRGEMFPGSLPNQHHCTGCVAANDNGDFNTDWVRIARGEYLTLRSQASTEPTEPPKVTTHIFDGKTVDGIIALCVRCPDNLLLLPRYWGNHPPTNITVSQAEQLMMITPEYAAERKSCTEWIARFVLQYHEPLAVAAE